MNPLLSRPSVPSPVRGQAVVTRTHHVDVYVVELGEDEDAGRGGEGADEEAVLLEVADVLPRRREVHQQSAHDQRQEETDTERR